MGEEDAGPRRPPPREGEIPAAGTPEGAEEADDLIQGIAGRAAAPRRRLLLEVEPRAAVRLASSAPMPLL